MLFLLIIAVIAVPGLALLGLIMAGVAQSRIRVLERKVLDLTDRLRAIEKREQAEPGTTQTEEVQPEQEAQESAADSQEEPPQTMPPAADATPEDRAPEARPITLEERFGTQWVVWTGGVALTLGGFFLLRYSIEQGWFGPEARVVLAGLLAVTLIAAGEWLRRGEGEADFAGISSAYIPGVLTAAGTVVAFADIYAAHMLYGLIGGTTAFVLLSLVALSTLAAALLHGPALAGLGLIGAFVTPAIIPAETPNYWALYSYLALTTAAALSLARLRHWSWLALATILLGALWSLPSLGDAASIGPRAVYLTVSLALAALLIVENFLFGPENKTGEADVLSWLALGAILAATTTFVLVDGADARASLVFIFIVAATIGIALHTSSASGAVPIAALAVGYVYSHWAFDLPPPDIVTLLTGPAHTAAQFERIFFGAPEAVGVVFAALFGISGFLAHWRCHREYEPIVWSLCAVAIPLFLLIATHHHAEGFERSLLYAAIALGLAVAFTLATSALDTRSDYPGQTESTATFATGAIAALALALALALQKGWLTIALAGMVPGIAWIETRRPWPVLRWLAATLVGLVLIRILIEPDIVGRELGTNPIFNWLLYGYGIPAAAFALAGRFMRAQSDDVPSRIVDAAAILMVVLLITMLVNHFISTGVAGIETAPKASRRLAEIGLDIVFLLALVIGLERIFKKNQSVVFDWGARFLAIVLFAVAAVGLGVVYNPIATGAFVGGPAINLVLLAYGIPAVLTAALAWTYRNTRPPIFAAVATAAAVILALGYFSLEVRTLFHGPILNVGPTTSAEQYTYSAVWLLFGVALLGAGVWTQSTALRICSAFVVALTVFKVFIVDMSNLTGIYRAISFLGLGVVLIVIGWFYQRLLFPRSSSDVEG